MGTVTRENFYSWWVPPEWAPKTLCSLFQGFHHSLQPLGPCSFGLPVFFSLCFSPTKPLSLGLFWFFNCVLKEVVGAWEGRKFLSAPCREMRIEEGFLKVS